MKRFRREALLPLFLSVAFLFTSCTYTRWNTAFYRPEGLVEVNARVAYLKCYGTNKHLYVFSKWIVDKSKKTVVGTGIHYDENRKKVERGQLALTFDQIELVETNVPETAYSITRGSLVVLSVLTVTIGLLCAANPKACFGSCPTFYTDTDDSLMLQAEGFSHSIAKVFEDSDIDALPFARPVEGMVHLRMTNEAMETHAVRQVKLGFVDKQGADHVYRDTEDHFYRAGKGESPSRALASSGDVTALLAACDNREYSSSADSNFLGTKEHLELTFASGEGPQGLVLASRQSLMTTFLLYQTMSSMGDWYGTFFDKLEHMDKQETGEFYRLEELLGGIDVELPDGEGGWTKVGRIGETGPIATEWELLPLPQSGADSLHVRLTMTQGAWRLDNVALVPLLGEADPVFVPPSDLTNYSGADSSEAFAALLDTADYLYTYPGDVYDMHFAVPKGLSDPEIFLYSKGYYYEWVRQHWLDERDPALLSTILKEPRVALTRLAKPYKRVEAKMEEHFWNSRYRRQP